LPVSAKGIEISMKGVMVTAFGKNPYGDGILLRLWEQAGNSGICTVTLPVAIGGGKAVPVNLRGEVQGNPIVIRGNSFSCNISKYHPNSFIITK